MHGGEDSLARIGKNPKESPEVLRLLLVVRRGLTSGCILWMGTHNNSNNNDNVNDKDNNNDDDNN